jgi:hypothetical protein
MATPVCAPLSMLKSLPTDAMRACIDDQQALRWR